MTTIRLASSGRGGSLSEPSAASGHDADVGGHGSASLQRRDQAGRSFVLSQRSMTGIIGQIRQSANLNQRDRMRRRAGDRVGDSQAPMPGERQAPPVLPRQIKGLEFGRERTIRQRERG